MSPEERLQAINQVLKQCRNSSFYRNRIPNKPLQSFAELKKIPLTTPEEVKQNPPFGLVCVPRTELYQYHETFGTTGNPVSTWLTKEDLLENAREVNESGICYTPEDIVLIRFPYAISAIAHIMHYAAQLKGACVIPASSRSTISPFPRIVNLLQKLEVTVLAGLPLQAVLIAETAEMMDLKPDRDFPKLRAICTAGEPVTPGRRKLLESIWGVPVIDIYGMAEIGTAIVDCAYGKPHPLEDYFYFEVLGEDLQTEVKPGEIGYLVVTTLKKKAVPLVRYVTGDRAKLVPKRCPCGAKASLEVHGRKQDTIIIKDRVFDLWDLEEIVSYLPCRRFWAVGPGTDGLRFVVEQERDGDVVGTRLIKRLENAFDVKLKIEVVPKRTLYNRGELLSIGAVGKPRYIYSQEEMDTKAYIQSTKY